MNTTNLPVAPVRVTIKNLSNYSLGLPPPIDQVIQRGATVTIALQSETELNQKDIADAVNRGLISISVVETNSEGGRPSLPLDPIQRGELVYTDHFQDLVADAAEIHTQTGASVAISIPAASFSGDQIDQPRTVRVVNIGAATGTVVVHGIMATGVGDAESISVTGAGTFEGGVPWAVVTSIDFPALGGGDSMEVETSSKLGLSGLISSQTSVFKVIKNGGDFSFLLTAVSASNGSFNTTGIAGSDNFTIRYKP
jgi:hypothetical protein